ncbi:LacI family DNA-binding transcriptional regulator [Citrobacter rodentium]|jgi:Transcriptional regulators|uniref:LacI-family transcriptional regulator n=2 Tax=Citrobacter rodentium TaxID=67825 RepID=D2TKA5_CITRI|nr:LacI family DNA-binding transcriptional regulator [Citrobacter rodentium]KIQ49430.1 LacI family transcriptional regulator [Citrobacter rodentium]QBY28260.1 LacI family transcriptional regulator [Citrobacter rodentium]UHO29866.1 LacI family transcriptional regulator [Citrobacter rodentium NBRC 105723 = DSM 16636]CBG88447.1 putative LacI-family transcriptional regulator [Citrobacter rodentium ICC168]HAT8013449.1 LacI family transcriptional regulator [Citrobacter rodentium NBRC 105723 = DSM 16
MSPTIYDIARVAGVSKSTVSRVLNKQTNISPEAREKVLRAIDELQYQPNKLARALTSSGFDAIMVISTRSTKTTAGNPFFSEVLHAITAKAEEEGFDVILQTSRSSEDDLQKCESKIKQKMIKGIIMLSSPADESFFARLDNYDIPVVVIGKVEGQYDHVYSVDTDNYRDSIALTDALIDSGHRHIACLHAPLDYHVSVDRVNGYKTSLSAHQLTIRDKWIIDGGYTHESALSAARALLSERTLPDAVFATDSLKLMSLYRAAAELNIAIPQQLAVVGYSNEMLSFILTPPPGGIDVPTQELGEKSCDLLFQLIRGKKELENIIVSTQMSFAGSI